MTRATFLMDDYSRTHPAKPSSALTEVRYAGPWQLYCIASTQICPSERAAQHGLATVSHRTNRQSRGPLSLVVLVGFSEHHLERFGELAEVQASDANGAVTPRTPMQLQEA